MRVDELNDETEAKMDALEDRTRALAARCDAAEKRAAEAERQRNSAETLCGLAEAERDAAVKAKEEVERKHAEFVAGVDAATKRIETKTDAAVSTSEDLAVTLRWRAERAEREAASLRAQVEQMRGAAEAVWDALNLENRGHPQAILAMRAARERFEAAALSPSPASGVAEPWGVDCSLCNRHWNQVRTREELDVRCARMGCPTRLPDPPAASPAKDEATR